MKFMAYLLNADLREWRKYVILLKDIMKIYNLKNRQRKTGFENRKRFWERGSKHEEGI